MSKKDQPYSSHLKGVAALLGESFNQTESTANSPNTVAINLIKLPASQPRRYFDPQKLEELSRSIKELGILEPLLVRPLPGEGYELVAGERRLRAAQLALINEVPVVIREMDDITTSKVQLVENLQREDLNPVEETEGILELLSIELGVTRNEVISVLNSAANAKKRNLDLTENVFRQLETIESVLLSIGKFSAESFRVSRIPLLNLPIDVLEVLRSGQIEYTKARAIARVQDDETRKQLLEDAKVLNLSLSEIKRKIQEIEQQTESEPPSIKDLADETFRRLKKSQVWDDPKKKAKVEKLLAQLNALMQDDNSIG
ncbi:MULTISPECIES: ParB/RepB/Spo0J family partition protein [Nostoc]|uniref:ParB/RepB/Spo0J family partition protein n=1 Tax=Nostoc paludosum FACHB-159 TaxID=2692908 RepID=A0ABR8KI27_9NOSO|nr:MULTISPECIES: ParB/RepB/Spo0J family partition protein [Nostoc]MBD2682882.1 ParB/RepB/Spo0J family partition protein [Nostoc sp. FACHB-857]MBD2739219.1 ParB/RepB/Spo0J family partition protein [Nostoc paludosum FACHB-159]